MGAKATTVPIYMAEISPKRIRGALVMSWQTCVALGIVLYVEYRLLCKKMYTLSHTNQQCNYSKEGSLQI